MSTPDFHFLFVPPALGPTWLMGAAQRYWGRFRPIAINNIELIGFVPPRLSVVITTFSRRDLAAPLRADLREKFPTARLDFLVYDAIEELRMTLDGRAALGQRFGLPGDALPPG